MAKTSYPMLRNGLGAMWQLSWPVRFIPMVSFDF